MYSIRLLGLAALLAAANASFTIPKDLPDGLHSVTVDASGKATFKQISQYSEPSQKWWHQEHDHTGSAAYPGPGGHARPNDKLDIKCGKQDGFAIKPEDVKKARFQVGSHLHEESIPKEAGTHLVGAFGPAAVYICNNGKSEVPKRGELRRDIDTIFGTCKGLTGSVEHKDEQRIYGFNAKGATIC